MRSFLVLTFLSIITIPLPALSYGQASQHSSYTLQTGSSSLLSNPLTGSGCVTGLNPPLHFTLLVPTQNPARRASAATIQQNLQCLGMNVSRVEVPFSPEIYDRALVPPASNLGKTFDQGGFDILLVGYSYLGIEPDPWSLYSSTQFAPEGSNYYLWNNTQNDNLTNLIKTTLNATIRDDYARQWQVLAANELPSIPLYYSRELVAFDSNFPNAQSIFSDYHFPAWPATEHLSTVTPDASMILAESGQVPGQGVIPELSNSYYDTAVSGEIFSPLALRNDTIFKTMIPDLAAGTPSAPGWSVASDNKTWTVNLRPGVTWQDGQPFTANDVKFTFDLIQNDSFGSPYEFFVNSIIGGTNNVEVTSPTQVVFHLPAPYAFFVQNILSTAILPRHILSAFSNDYSRILSSLFNRPDIGSTSVSSSLPVGTGPYNYVGYDAISSTNHLVRNDNYYNFSDWGKSALLAKGQFGVRDYYVRTIVGADQAITALTRGQVDVLDSQYQLWTNATFLNSWGTNRLSSYDGFAVQEMGVNMEHPILGTGTGTPLGLENPSMAAVAARYVRQAISYAVPRDQLINQFLNGYGVPAITTPIIGDYRTGFAVTEGFNTALQPYAYNLTRASELLQLAGYQILNPLPPTVKITSISPTAVSTGQTVTVGFAISSNVLVSAIAIDWGDGTISHPSTTSTSDIHVYTFAPHSNSHTFLITVTVTNSAGTGSTTATMVVRHHLPSHIH